MCSDFSLKTNEACTRERQHDIRPEDTSWRYLWLVNKGERTSTGPLALSYLDLVLPVTFGHIIIALSNTRRSRRYYLHLLLVERLRVGVYDHLYSIVTVTILYHTILYYTIRYYTILYCSTINSCRAHYTHIYIIHRG